MGMQQCDRVVGVNCEVEEATTSSTPRGMGLPVSIQNAAWVSKAVTVIPTL